MPMKNIDKFCYGWAGFERIRSDILKKISLVRIPAVSDNGSKISIHALYGGVIMMSYGGIEIFGDIEKPVVIFQSEFQSHHQKVIALVSCMNAQSKW